MKTSRPNPPASDRIPNQGKVAYGIGSAGERLQTGSFAQLANPIFNDVLGIDPRVIGLVLGGSRILDAVTDPIVGHLSDRTRSRWGRRRPWIFGGAVLSAVVFAGMWLFPRGMSTEFYVAWFLGSAVLLQLGLSLFSVPHGALGMELTPDYHERTSLMTVRSMLNKIGGMLISTLFVVITWSTFDDMADGMRYVGPIMAGLVLVLGLAPAWFNREHPGVTPQHARRRGPGMGFLASARHTLKSRPFLTLISISAVMIIGLTMVSHLSYYLTIYYMFDGERNAASGLVLTLCGYAAGVGGLLGLPVLNRLSRRVGKTRALGYALMGAAACDLTKWVCFSPTHPYLALIPNFSLAFVLSSSWMLLAAMLPDVVDFDEMQCGERRAGMFAGVQGWTVKLGMSLALVMSGFILNASGFDTELGANQSERTITFIRVCYTFIPAGAMVVAAVLLRNYPLSESRMRSVRMRLDRRHRLEDVSADSGAA